MDIKIRSDRGARVAVLKGEFDWAVQDDAEQCLFRETTPGCKVVLDMSGVSFVGSGGLRVLLKVFRRAQDNQGRLVLSGLPPEIRDVMDLTGFLDFFKTYDTVEDGIAALNS